MSVFKDVSNNVHTTFIAIATILMVTGVPHLIDEKKYDIKKFFGNSLIKKLVLFSVLYMNTKDIYISIFATIGFSLLLDVILAKPLTPNEINEISNPNL